MFINPRTIPFIPIEWNEKMVFLTDCSSNINTVGSNTFAYSDWGEHLIHRYAKINK